MQGKISQIMGAVVDVEFSDGNLPKKCNEIGYDSNVIYAYTSGAPTKVLSVTKSAVNRTTLTLEWSAPLSDGGSPVLEYNIDVVIYFHIF